MSTAFSFRLTPETTWDEKNGGPILSLILGTVARTSVGERSTNEAKTHRPGFANLTAGGLSDSVTLNRVQTPDKGFDVSPASAASQFFPDSARSAVPMTILMTTLFSKPLVLPRCGTALSHRMAC